MHSRGSLLMAACLCGMLLGAAFRVAHAQPETQHPFSGYVRSAKDSSAVAYAHVVVSHRNAFAITSETGYFSLSVKVGDTVLVSSVQYVARGLVITEPPVAEEQIIWMQERVYELQGVTVYPKEVMRGFFTHQRIPYDSHYPEPFRRLRPKFRLGGRNPSSRSDELTLFTIDGLLSGLLAPLNTEYRQMKKLHALRKQRQLRKYYENLITERVPLELIQRYLPLRADERDAFLDFWQPELLLLEMTSNYELRLELKEACLEYLAHLERKYSFRSYPQRVTTLELRALLSPSPASSDH